MYAFKYDSVAHAEHEVMCPLSRPKIDFVVDLLGLSSEARVLDLAAGKGELLIRILERYGCTGEGLEPSPLFQAAARGEAASRLEKERVRLHDVEPSDFPVEAETYDLVICLGSRPYGDLAETLRRAWAMVRTGGHLLLGEWHWTSTEPDPDYIDFLGCGTDAYETHSGVVAMAAKEAFTPIYMVTASVDEIDHYESLSTCSIERWLRSNPGDVHAGAIRERSRKWRDAYLEWGRHELGFGLYLLLK
ncbi:MAG: class I SAM-dependent methyltransferase [Myxococcota bacterium]